jgi:hypothetical protein
LIFVIGVHVPQSVESVVHPGNPSLPVAIALSLVQLRQTRMRSSRLMSEGTTAAAIHRQLWMHEKMLRHLGEIGFQLAEIAGNASGLRRKRAH